MTERDMLLRSILTEPDDDTARLVFADWLDENGESQWAALIRQQVNDLRKPQTHRPGQAAEYVWHLTPTPLALAPAVPGWQYTTDRGFVSEIHLPTAGLLEHAKAIFAAHPVTRVVLTDRAMYPNGAGYSWYKANRDGRRTAPGTADIPGPIFEHLTDHIAGGKRYKSYQRDTAEPALSRACVAYGRELVGLPPLPTRTIGAA